MGPVYALGVIVAVGLVWLAFEVRSLRTSIEGITGSTLGRTLLGF